ncbi:Myosin-5 [Morella rubra]|uniref:Myosin-5 n=1 Tax=Morella rubra TaxID=262757 RepID=A0A6A1VKX7_9ROSI|nr:Myosin-5 [Morella rubra]
MVHSWDTSSIFSFSFSGLPLRLGFCFSIFFLRLLEGTSKEESSRNSPQLKMKDLQEVSSQSKRKSLKAPPNEPHVERKHATSPLVPKQGSSIIISEVQKGGRVRAPSPSESLIPNFMGLTQGTTYIGSDPAGSPPFVPQGEVLQDQVSNLEDSVIGIEENDCKLRESLALKEERIGFLEGEARHLSGQAKFQEDQVKNLIEEVHEVGNIASVTVTAAICLLLAAFVSANAAKGYALALRLTLSLSLIALPISYSRCPLLTVSISYRHCPHRRCPLPRSSSNDFGDYKLFRNSLLLRCECCAFSNGEYVKSGLAELEKWIVGATEEKRFTIPEPPLGDIVKSWFLKDLGEKWRNYKCSLKKYFDEAFTPQYVKSNAPTDVNLEQFCKLVDFWYSDVGRKRMEEIQMNELTISQPLSQSTMGGSISWSPSDRYAQVIGPERHGRIRGVGLGPTPSSYSANTSRISTQPASSNNEEMMEMSSVKTKMLPISISTKFHHQFLDHLVQVGKTFDDNVDGEGEGVSGSVDGAESAGAGKSAEAAKD